MNDTAFAAPPQRHLQHYLILAAFIAVVLGGGMLIGLAAPPDQWFATLRKPSFMPPNWLFAPVWSVLYVLIAIAGWRTWMRRPQSPAMAAWVIQLLANFVWSPLFFRAHSPAAALIAIAVLLVAVMVFIAQSSRSDRVAAWLFVPYGLWVGFAALLNVAILALN